MLPSLGDFVAGLVLRTRFEHSFALPVATDTHRCALLPFCRSRARGEHHWVPRDVVRTFRTLRSGHMHAFTARAFIAAFTPLRMPAGYGWTRCYHWLLPTNGLQRRCRRHLFPARRSLQHRSFSAVVVCALACISRVILQLRCSNTWLACTAAVCARCAFLVAVATHAARVCTAEFRLAVLDAPRLIYSLRIAPRFIHSHTVNCQRLFLLRLPDAVHDSLLFVVLPATTRCRFRHVALLVHSCLSLLPATIMPGSPPHLFAVAARCV